MDSGIPPKGMTFELSADQMYLVIGILYQSLLEMANEEMIRVMNGERVGKCHCRKHEYLADVLGNLADKVAAVLEEGEHLEDYISPELAAHEEELTKKQESLGWDRALTEMGEAVTTDN